jgi:hypothetical protein
MGTHAVIKEKLESVKADYAKDLAALPHEALEVGPGGSARAPYDFTYEVVVVNDRMANAIKGVANGPWPFDGWAVAPAEFRNRERAVAEITRSLDGMIATWSALGEDEIDREITSPTGAKATPLDFALMCVQHTGYHDAQLNYVQTLNGDMDIHWE